MRPVERAWDRGVGVVMALGLHTGAGLGVRLGGSTVGVELVGAWQPLLAVTEPDFVGSRDIYAGSSVQAGAELTLMPWHPKPWSAVGIKGGYRYNSVLTHGFGFAIAFMADLGNGFAVEGCAGASVFPGQEDTLRAALDIPDSDRLIYSSAVQFYEYGLELIWYP